MLTSFETSFAGALLSADQPIPPGITAHNAAVPTRRFAVYRNNVIMGLRKTLQSRFPAVESPLAICDADLPGSIYQFEGRPCSGMAAAQNG